MAWIVASSLDARNCASGGGDSVMSPGRRHYRCNGPVVYGSHSFMTWLLARINPQHGEPFAAYWRRHARAEAFTTGAAEAAADMPAPNGLERLERLRDGGILSDTEFDAERAKLEAQQ